MTKIDIFSGFLGAGKTTLIKKLITESFAGQKVVLIENEFGEIGIDGGFLQESGIQINELNSGCICCSLVGDFREALKQVVREYTPDRIVIEPSGVGKLSDVTRAVEAVAEELPVQLESFVTVADVNKVKMYMKNFGEFYDDQISHASCIILSRTQNATEAKIAAAVQLIQAKNDKATIVTTPWDDLTGAQILTVMGGKVDFVTELLQQAQQANAHAHEHEHHHHEHGEHCDCGCHDHDHEHHHHDEHEHEHHHHHEHDEHCDCGCHDHDHEHHHHDEHEHHHHHEHGEHCDCGCHDHDHEHHHHEHHYDEHGVCSCGHHHDHHADEVFTSWGVETAKKFTRQQLEQALAALDSGEYGMVLRAKGIVDGGDGWYEFDFVPGEYELRARSADVTGRLVVIGSKLDEQGVAALFGL